MPKQTDELYFPDIVTQAQTACALRFAGYEYEASKDPSGENGTGGLLYKLERPIIENLILHPLVNDNFAAFFGLQRALHKWGGEYLTKYSPEHIAYDFLFLHLYTLQPPKKFCNAEYCAKWQNEFAHQAERIAAIVRLSFRRTGETFISK